MGPKYYCDACDIVTWASPCPSCRGVAKPVLIIPAAEYDALNATISRLEYDKSTLLEACKSSRHELLDALEVEGIYEHLWDCLSNASDRAIAGMSAAIAQAEKPDKGESEEG